MKKQYLILIGIGVSIILFIMVFRPGGGGEDSWIKDERGVWVKHGVPYKTPDYVLEQQEAIGCALQLYEEMKNIPIVFSSQCLGTCGNYAVDIVHVPRSQEDNQIENQCEDYRTEEVSNFIELDKGGNMIRIV